MNKNPYQTQTRNVDAPAGAKTDFFSLQQIFSRSNKFFLAPTNLCETTESVARTQDHLLLKGRRALPTDFSANSVYNLRQTTQYKVRPSPQNTFPKTFPPRKIEVKIWLLRKRLAQ